MNRYLTIALSAMFVMHSEAQPAAPAATQPVPSATQPAVKAENRRREFLDVIKRQFRGLNSAIRILGPMIGHVSFRKSAPDEMLQFVDMVCGAVGALIDHGDSTWYDLIADRDLCRQPSA